jgi:gag-polypeptide of LTR copia-type
MKLSENEKIIFNGSNHAKWKPAAKLFLMSEGLGLYLIPPVLAVVPEEKHYETQAKIALARTTRVSEPSNMKALGLIGRLVSTDYKKTILNFETAYEAWEYLDANYGPGGENASKTISKRAFYNMTQSKGQAIAAFTAELQEAMEILEITDTEMHEFIFETTASPFPQDWQPWLSTIKEIPEYNNWDNLKIKIEKEGRDRGYDGKNHEKSALETSKSKHVKCNYCKWKGHQESDCRKKQRDRDNGKINRNNDRVQENPFAKRKEASSATKTKTKVRWALTLVRDKQALETSEKHYDIPNTNWKYDTACTDHCTPHREILSDYKEISSVINTAKSGEQMKIVGVGSVVLKTPSGDHAVLKEVLHVPSMARNLLSGSMLTEKGLDTSLNLEGVTVSKNNEVILQGEFKESSWQVELEYVQSKKALEVTRGIKILSKEEELQHARLGHTHDPQGRLSGCNACSAAKSIRLPFNKSKPPSNQKGAFSVDLIGPVYGQYAATCVYHDSDETAVIILDYKGQFFEEFKILAAFWETQYEAPLKVMYADGYHQRESSSR